MATLESGVSDSSVGFTVSITNDCDGDVLSVSSTVADDTYTLLSPATPVTYTPAFSQSVSGCPVTYSVTIDGSSTLDAAVMSFDNSVPSLTVSTAE